MAISKVLCLATEQESTECGNLYMNFKRTLQGKSNDSLSYDIYDVRSINDKPVRGNNNLDNKLEKKVDYVHAVLVICSPALKSYLDGEKPSGNDLLKKDERKALLKSLTKHKDKVILIHLDSKFSTYIPNLLTGVDLVDGTNDMGTLETKLLGKL